MNMKKTIAAIAAGAVAVSAMATTVSAFGEQTLHYNLVRTVKTTSNGTVTLTTTVPVTYFTGGTDTIVYQNANTNLRLGSTVELALTGYDTNNRLITVVYSSDSGSTNYSANFENDGTTVIFTMPTTTRFVDDSNLTINMTVRHNTDWVGNINSGLGLIDYVEGGATYTTAADGVITITGGAPAVVPVASSFTGNSDKFTYYPLKTSIADRNNIISYLQTGTNNLRNTDSASTSSYSNVMAVLNDAITNYDDITFTFNTATKSVMDAAAVTAEGNSWKKDNGDYVEGAYVPDSTNWIGAEKYLNFGQQIYDGSGYYGSTGYVDSYNFYNLFSGALVVNEAYSMSLSDTNTFTYGATSLSFNWEDVKDTNSGSQINSWITYVQYMVLLTSDTWYWDSLDVVLANTEVDTVDTTAPVEAEEDLIDDEEVIDEEIFEEIEEIEVPEVVEEAPAPVVSNPTTGNASVALAVIPVALAAAAIIAKKRG